MTKMNAAGVGADDDERERSRQFSAMQPQMATPQRHCSRRRGHPRGVSGWDSRTIACRDRAGQAVHDAECVENSTTESAEEREVPEHAAVHGRRCRCLQVSDGPVPRDRAGRDVLQW